MNKVTCIKNRNYTTISNSIFRETNLSLKAKGLLALILTLPDDWDFTIDGIASIIKEGKTAIYSAIDELKAHGYCKVEISRNASGVFIGNDYTFFETPYTENPYLENPHAENPNMDNQTQINKDIYNIYNKQNKDINNNKEKEDKSSLKKKPNTKDFIPPTIQEVEAYIKAKGYRFSAKAFVDYYEADDWHYGKGANRKKVSNWKRCCATWDGNRNNNNDLFSQSLNSNEEDMMQKFLDLPDSEQAKILQLDAYQYHMLPASAKEGWMNNRKQFILQWFTENGQ